MDKSINRSIIGYKYYLGVVALFVLLFPKMYSQPNTLYFMDGIHQSGFLNPAYTGKCNGFLSLPAISGIFFNTDNTGFDYNDFIHLGTGNQKDSLILDLDNVKSKLSNNNYLLAQTFVPILGFGFWSGNSFITFEISNRIKFNTKYPSELAGLLEGNAQYVGEDNPLIIKGFGPNTMSYNEFALGWSKRITHRLKIGTKLKFLDGVANVKTNSSEIKLYTADTTYAMRLETDLSFNISAPVDFTYDDNGLISGIDYDSDNLVKDLTPTKNLGFALDLGAIYQFDDKLSFYASVTDLGFIHWDDHSTKLSQSGTFSFSGLTLDSIWSGSDYNEMDAVLDSLTEFFHFEHTDSKYTTMLNTNLYLGANYQVIPAIGFGFLSRTLFLDNGVQQAFTASSNFKPVKILTASLSYSIMSREYKNLGIGLALNLGPFQFYALTDNLYAAFVPKNSKTFSLFAGLNLNFGCGKRDNFSMLNSKNPEKSIDFK